MSREMTILALEHAEVAGSDVHGARGAMLPTGHQGTDLGGMRLRGDRFGGSQLTAPYLHGPGYLSTLFPVINFYSLPAHKNVYHISLFWAGDRGGVALALYWT